MWFASREQRCILRLIMTLVEFKVLVGEEEPEDIAVRRFMKSVMQSRLIEQVALCYLQQESTAALNSLRSSKCFPQTKRQFV